MMANSSRDPYWQAGIRRETLDHPESKALIEDECSKCHMPMARYEAILKESRERLRPLPAQRQYGVGGRMACPVRCAIRSHRKSSGPAKAGRRFRRRHDRSARAKPVYGPYKIEDGQNRIMRSSSDGFRPTEGEHIRKVRVVRHVPHANHQALGPGGKVIGSNFPNRCLIRSGSQANSETTKSCQNCHMPEVKDVAVAVPWGETRNMGRHIFVGGNFFILRMLNRYRGELGVWALPRN